MLKKLYEVVSNILVGGKCSSETDWIGYVMYHVARGYVKRRVRCLGFKDSKDIAFCWNEYRVPGLYMSFSSSPDEVIMFNRRDWDLYTTVHHALITFSSVRNADILFVNIERDKCLSMCRDRVGVLMKRYRNIPFHVIDRLTKHLIEHGREEKEEEKHISIVYVDGVRTEKWRIPDAMSSIELYEQRGNDIKYFYVGVRRAK